MGVQLKASQGTELSSMGSSVAEKWSSIVLSVNIRSKENNPSSSFSTVKADDSYSQT